jgi:broad specificity phosphatase PhoE
MTATTLFLVRHGQTAWHRANRYAGRADLELDATGRAQAAKLAGWAATAALSGVVSSTLRRAVQTARPAAAAASLALECDDRLRELDFGRAEGLRLADLRSSDPDAVRRFEDDPAAHPLPGGEDPVAAAARGRDCLLDVAATHPGGRVLVVAHNTLLRLALCELLGVPLRDYRRRFGQVVNGALTEIELGAGGAALRRYNAPVTDVRSAPGPAGAAATIRSR